MKRILFLALLFAPSVLCAQLDKDGKSELTSVRVKPDDRGTHSILFSGSSLTPFGIKYQYYKKLGGYVSFKTDADLIGYDFIISAGLARATGKRSNFWIGGGIDLGYDEEYDYDAVTIRSTGIEVETGWLFVAETGFSFEVGIGCTLNEYYSYNEYNWEGEDYDYRARPFLILGLGYSF